MKGISVDKIPELDLTLCIGRYAPFDGGWQSGSVSLEVEYPTASSRVFNPKV